MIPTRILLVEDRAAAIEFIGKTLIDAGYQVVIAWTGAVGIQRAAEYHPDLILLNARLDERDGKSFQQAYETAFGYSPPIVLLETANGWSWSQSPHCEVIATLLMLIRQALADTQNRPALSEA